MDDFEEKLYLPQWMEQLGYELQERIGIHYIIPPMVEIPAGEFLMGSDKRKYSKAHTWECPQFSMYSNAFEIGKYPVTVAEYILYMEAMRCKAPYSWDDQKQLLAHPVVYVTWYDAQSYAKWLSEMTGERWKLPSEAAWEKAARGTDGRIWPWGNKFDDCKANTSEKEPRTTTPVGMYPLGASPYGVMDMAGNVFEWTSTVYKEYPYDAEDGREDENSVNNRVYRGGAWYYYSQLARVAYRNYGKPDSCDIGRGFRLMHFS